MKIKFILLLVALFIVFALAFSIVGFGREFAGNGADVTPMYENIWNTR